MFKQLMVVSPKNLARIATVLAVSSMPMLAMAAPVDYTAITEAVDWSSVVTGVIAILALGAAVIVAFMGGKMLVKAIKGA